MRTDILDLHRFYESPLGAAARDFIAARLAEAWGEAARLRVAGFGYASPFLSAFDAAERVLHLAPDAQGAMRWPADGRNLTALVDEAFWPLPDVSIDRLLIVHGLEEASAPRRLMREAWRVLANGGRVIIVAAHRRGLWSMVETTPFAAGRPWLKRQLDALLAETMFRPLAWSGALYFPPYGARFLLRAAAAWERAGSRLWPGLSGVLMVEAAKELLAPVGQVQRARRLVAGPLRPRPAQPAASRAKGAP
ncbi:class I SAM-dependent methyltransferase [Amphiplicatus metriothermophilus]|uniref:Methyltransferase domain-containing protein n=1 Tax=Amphiplicatus metriothermophilus TaxID=1519374 RepID=A0A239PKQ4_9PROT|nr:methyltransferase domain-containing protein [Amphiplicatus metriothermophilus]MBB5517266.1 SAM-dependent methyltransferase [Amphiplicatus metriothermophilus]SNT68398.1 Methyltransferase domain-containing protein [Amphiplicatus metriothermophilus]